MWGKIQLAEINVYSNMLDYSYLAERLGVFVDGQKVEHIKIIYIIKACICKVLGELWRARYHNNHGAHTCSHPRILFKIVICIIYPHHTSVLTVVRRVIRWFQAPFVFVLIFIICWIKLFCYVKGSFLCVGSASLLVETLETHWWLISNNFLLF